MIIAAVSRPRNKLESFPCAFSCILCIVLNRMRFQICKLDLFDINTSSLKATLFCNIMNTHLMIEKGWYCIYLFVKWSIMFMCNDYYYGIHLLSLIFLQNNPALSVVDRSPVTTNDPRALRNLVINRWSRSKSSLNHTSLPSFCLHMFSIWYQLSLPPLFAGVIHVLYGTWPIGIHELGTPAHGPPWPLAAMAIFKTLANHIFQNNIVHVLD